MSLSIYNPSLIIIPCNFEFNQYHLERTTSAVAEAEFCDMHIRGISLLVGVGGLILGPIVVIPARLLCAIWNAVVGVFAILGGVIFQNRDCQDNGCWAFQDLASECHALISFVLAYPVMVTLSLAGAIIHPAIATPAWGMLAYLCAPYCCCSCDDEDAYIPPVYTNPRHQGVVDVDDRDLPYHPPTANIERRHAEFFTSLLESRRFSDMMLVVGEERVPAHKLILSMESAVLKEILEREESDQLVIENANREVVEHFLRYLYTKTGDFSTLSLDRIRQLFALAAQYQVEGLDAYLLHHVSTRLNDQLENYDLSVILNIAESQRNDQLKRRCESEFIRRLNRNNDQIFSDLAEKYHLEDLQAQCQAIQVSQH
jgi:hypothetical protein